MDQQTQRTLPGANVIILNTVFNEGFNRQTGKPQMVYQPARLVIPQYRIVF